MNAYGSLSDDSHEETVVATILDVNLPREAVPTKFLKSPRIWEALLQKMPPEAMIRNLGNMTKIDCLKPMNDATNLVRNRLTDQVVLQKARSHPIDVLVAMKTYASGRGLMGKGTWSPIQTIVDALDRAFYLAFKAVEPTGKRIMLALDISGSMQHPAGGLPISCREAVAAIAMVTAAVEPNHYIVGFTSGNRPSRWTTMSRAHANLGSGLTELKISPSQRLDHVVNYIAAFPMGGTDCSLPMIHALERKLDVDAFVVLTDNETWHGEIHPMQALRQYRQERNIDSKLVVVAMTPEKFSIADPTDAGSLDVVGFDSATPALISEFIR
jgi:60 kDa SS-A/Ro ribonucleoprotein